MPKLLKKPLTEVDSQMYEIVLTQLRNLQLEASLDYLVESGYLVLLVETMGVRPVRILCVVEQKITRCMYAKTGKALWRADILKGVEPYDAVAVFYGESIEVGALWRESQGNPNKDDYRRLSRIRDIQPCRELGEGCYWEIDTILSEANLQALILGEPLQDFRRNL